jgi:hypothetical protein
VKHTKQARLTTRLFLTGDIHMRLTIVSFALLSLAIHSVASAIVVEYTNKASWQAAAGIYSTITFAELPVNTLVTNQYSNLGVVFTDGSDYIDGFYPNTYLNDGYGLNGALDDTWLAFSQPMYTIAVDYPGSVDVSLYLEGQLIYASSHFHIPGGLGGFAGLVSDVPFDTVHLTDIESGLFIDDLHFGPTIPASGAMALLIAAGLVQRRRR